MGPEQFNQFIGVIDELSFLDLEKPAAKRIGARVVTKLPASGREVKAIRVDISNEERAERLLIELARRGIAEGVSLKGLDYYGFYHPNRRRIPPRFDFYHPNLDLNRGPVNPLILVKTSQLARSLIRMTFSEDVDNATTDIATGVVAATR